MSNTKSFDQSELIRLALIGLDTQIAELQAKRTQLTTLHNQKSVSPVVKTTAPQRKGGKMSEEAKAKISAATKARWARVKQEQAKATKTIATPKKAQSAPIKAKKSPARKGKATLVKAAKKAGPKKATS